MKKLLLISLSWWQVAVVWAASANGLTVTGQVVDSKARAVEGAEVAIYEAYSIGRLDFDFDGKLIAPIVKTDSRGQFQMQVNVTNQYFTFVVARKTGLALAWDGLNYSMYTKGKGYFLLVLEPACVLAGQVVDPNGKPVAKAQVQAVPVNSYLDRLRQRPIFAPKEWFTTTTDSQGKFRFEQFAADVSATYRVKAPGWSSTHVFQTLSSHGFEVGRGDIQLILPREGIVQGVADAKGVARLRVPTGSNAVDVGAEQFSLWQSRKQVANGQTLPFEASRIPKRRLYGRVRDPGGQPVADAAVTVHPFGDHVYSDAKGQFGAGWDYRHAAKGGFAVARDAKTGLASAVLVTDWSKPVDLKLGLAWTLAGKITDPNGTGIPAARVSLCMDTRNALSGLGVELLTDPQGRFEMKAIPPVQDGFDYRLSVNAAGYGPKNYSKISPSGQPGASVNLGAIELPLADQSVSGVVVDANGAPAPHVPIFVTGLRGISQPSKSTVADQNGNFTITRLCKGPVLLQANFLSSPGGPGVLWIDLPAENVKIILGMKLTER